MLASFARLLTGSQPLVSIPPLDDPGWQAGRGGPRWVGHGRKPPKDERGGRHGWFDSPQGTAPNVILKLATGRIAGIPWAVLLWIVVSAVLIFVLKRTVYGRRLYAIGNNPRASYLSGVPVRRVLIVSYTAAGLFAGITGLLLTGYSNQSYIRMGDAYVLPSIAAVVVGGTSILGGSGGYVGTIAGAIIITLLQNVLSIENRSQADQQILFGLIVLIMLFIYGREAKVRE